MKAEDDGICLTLGLPVDLACDRLRQRKGGMPGGEGDTCEDDSCLARNDV
jgi:hypothetical protein